MSDAASHQILVDSAGWEGRRDVLAQRVAELLGQPASRVRATLAVPGTPVLRCADEREAESIVARMREIGVTAHAERAGASAVVGGVRIALADDGNNRSPTTGTIQPGWSRPLAEPDVRVHADGSTVVGMPSSKSSMQRTLLLGDGAAAALAHVDGGGDDSGYGDDGGAGAAAKPTRKTPTGAHRALVGNAAKQVRAKEALRSPPSAGAWSDVLGGALGARLLGDDREPPNVAPPVAVASPGPLVDQPITPNSAATMAPVSPRTASTATQLAAGSTRVHGPERPVAPGRAAPASAFDEVAADLQSAWPEAYSAEKPVQPSVSEARGSAAPGPVPVPHADGLLLPPDATSGAWNTSPDIGDGFALLRRQEEASVAPISWPTLKTATFFAVVAPGAGHAYATGARDGLVYALGAAFVKPWYDGVVDIRESVRDVERGASLPRRSASVVRGAAFVGVFWTAVAALTVAVLAGVQASRGPDVPIFDEQALQAAANERRANELAAAAAAAEEQLAEARERSRAEQAERAEVVQRLLQNARLACGMENYRLCREYTEQLLEVDSDNLQGLRLHASAVNEGRTAPDPVDASDDAPSGASAVSGSP